MPQNTILPNAFIIGAQKAGTTSLHQWLMQHPDVFSSLAIKDIDFFEHPRHAGNPVGSFNRAISGYDGEKVVLQTHVNYILYESSLKKIKALIVNSPKFILVLRDPVERAISAYRYFRKVLREERPPKEALEYNPQPLLKYSPDNNDFTYIEHGFYFRQLQAFEKYFSLEDLLILDFDQLQSNPSETVKKAFRFLGIDENFEPVFEKKNVTGKTRFAGLQKAIYKSSPLKRLLIRVLDPFFNQEKRLKMKHKMLELNTAKTKDNLVIGPDIKTFLFDTLKPDMLEMNDQYKLNFVDDWLSRYG